MSTTTLKTSVDEKSVGLSSADQDALQIVSFRLANEEYGVNIMNVQEIILIGRMTEMPQVPESVCGLINLRGHVIPIIDLRVRFRLNVTERTEHSRIIVLNIGKRTIGIIVDEVNEVFRINRKQIEPTPSGLTGVGQGLVTGLVKLENKLLILLDVERLSEGSDE